MPDAESALACARRLVRERRKLIADLVLTITNTDWRGRSPERDTAAAVVMGHNIALRVLVRHVELLESRDVWRVGRA